MCWRGTESGSFVSGGLESMPGENPGIKPAAATNCASRMGKGERARVEMC